MVQRHFDFFYLAGFVLVPFREPNWRGKGVLVDFSDLVPPHSRRWWKPYIFRKMDIGWYFAEKQERCVQRIERRVSFVVDILVGRRFGVSYTKPSREKALIYHAGLSHPNHLFTYHHHFFFLLPGLLGPSLCLLRPELSGSAVWGTHPTTTNQSPDKQAAENVHRSRIS